MNSIEYKMSKKMYNALLEDKPVNENPQSYVLKIVNEQFGLKGTVERIITYTD